MTKKSNPKKLPSKKLPSKKLPSKKSPEKSSLGKEILEGDKAEILNRLFDGEEGASFTRLLMSRQISGPLPSAEEFAGYGKVLDSAPADIIKMAKNQQKARFICSCIITSPTLVSLFFAFLAFVVLVFIPAPAFAWIIPSAFLMAAVLVRIVDKE